MLIKYKIKYKNDNFRLIRSFKRSSFNFCLNEVKSPVVLMSWGKSFHSFGVAASKATSPSLVLTLGGDKRILLLDLRWDIELFLKVIRFERCFSTILWIALKVIVRI